MRKVSLKVLIFASICALAALGGCLDPVNLTAFLNDDDVKETIKKNMASVILVSPDVNGNGGSEGKPGNGKITGLDPNKYYMIERWDEDTPPGKLTDSTDIRFVTANGGLTGKDDLEGIGRLIGSEITGLINNNTYRVTSAKPLSTDNFTTPPSATTSAGQITLPHTATGTMSLASSSLLDGDFVTIPVPSAGSPPWPSSEVSDGIALKGPGTTTDYVFYDDTLGRDGFYVLQVKINPVPVTTGSLTITVNYVNPAEKTFTFTPSNANYTQAAALGTLNISVVASSLFDSAGGWYYNGKLVTSTATLDKAAIDAYNPTAATADKIDITVIGSHKFTFVGNIGTSPAVPYSGEFTITITAGP